MEKEFCRAQKDIWNNNETIKQMCGHRRRIQKRLNTTNEKLNERLNPIIGSPPFVF